jgi:hypothetical protein
MSKHDIILYERHRDKDCYLIQWVDYDIKKNIYKFVVILQFAFDDIKIPALVSEDHRYLYFKDKDGQYKYIPFLTLDDDTPKDYHQFKDIGYHGKDYVDRREARVLQYRFINREYTISKQDMIRGEKRVTNITFKVVMMNIKNSQKTKTNRNRNYEYLVVSFALHTNSTLLDNNLLAYYDKSERGRSGVESAKWFISVYMKKSLKDFFPKGGGPVMRFRFIDWYD